LGTTGQVYLARAPDGRPVALKIPRAEVHRDPALAERFAREVRLSLGLSHPHLVKGIAGKPYGKDAFLALEYFEEGSLEDRLQKGPLPRERALAYLRQLAEALLHLHRLGIVHQDVKPANVFLRGEVAKLGDFGVAKTREDASPLRPFYGESYDELLAAHLTQKPLPLKDADPRIARAVMGLLVKDPGERLSPTDFLRALEPAPDAPPTARAAAPGPRRFWQRLLRRKP